MNTGFFLFGLVVLAGTLMLRGLPGRRRRTLLAAAAALAVGGVVLSLFPGSGEPVDEGAVDYHSLGALLGFVGGNVLVILLGRLHRFAGFSRNLGRGLIAAGCSVCCPWWRTSSTCPRSTFSSAWSNAGWSIPSCSASSA